MSAPNSSQRCSSSGSLASNRISGVQVAVARVEHVGAAQAVFLFHLLDGQQDVGQAFARDGGVHAHVVGADAPAGGKGVLAPAPEAQALGFAFAHRDGRGARAAQHFAHVGDLFLDFLGRAVALAQQDGLGREVVAGLDEVLDGGRHGLIHHLQPGRDDAGRDHGGHGVAGLAHVVEAGHDAARQLRLGDQAHGDFGGHGQHALAADQDGQQVEARRVQRRGAELHRLALHGEATHLEHVVHRQPVLEAVHAARVLGHVAADGAGDLAAGIGRVVQAEGRGGLADGQVAHAALHHGRAAGRIDLQDLVELGQRQRHAHGMGQGTARQPGARAARDHGHLDGVAGSQHGLDLGLGLGQADHQRALAVGREAVAFIGRGVLGIPQQGVGGHMAGQRGHDLGLAPCALGDCRLSMGRIGGGRRHGAGSGAGWGAGGSHGA